MTDYFDKPAKKASPAKVVSVSLAGVLAAGMVPAMAFAQAPGTVDEVAPVSSDGIMPIATDAETLQYGQLVLKAGSSTTYTAKLDNNNNVAKQGPTVVGINPSTGGTMVSDYSETFESATLYAFPIGTEASGTKTPYLYNGQTVYMKKGASVTTYTSGMQDPGTYAIVLANTETATSTAVLSEANVACFNAIEFTINPASLSGAGLFELQAALGNGVGTKVSDTTFTFRGTAYSVGVDSGDLAVQLGGRALPNSVYSAAIYGPTSTENQPYTTVTYAGSYQVVVTGKGIYAGSQVAIPFSIDPIDMSGYTITLKPSAPAQSKNNAKVDNLEVNGQAMSSVAGLSGISSILTVAQPSENYTTVGIYNVDLTFKQGNAAQAAGWAASVKGIPTTASYPIVTGTVPPTVGFTYGSTSFSSTDAAPLRISTAQGESFDPALVKVVNNAVPFPSSAITMRVYDSENQYVGATVPSTPGIYTVVVSVDPATATVNWEYAASDILKVQVTGGEVSQATLLFTATVDGKTVNIDTTTNSVGGTAFTLGDYTGTAYQVNVSAKTVSGQIVPEDAYTVVIKNSKGTVVSSIVDADTYTVVAESKAYMFPSQNGVKVKVNPVTLDASNLRVSGVVYGNLLSGNVIKVDQNSVDPYEYGWFATGSAITPQIQFQADGAWKDLPQDVYALSFMYTSSTSVTKATDVTEPATEIKAPGAYVVKVSAATPASTNFSIGGTVSVANPAGFFVVTDQYVFADVPSDAWYASAVFDAAEQDYMTGYGDSALFGPNDPLDRAQAATIFARMASVNLSNSTPEGSVSGTTEYPTKFADVNAKAWYAKAVLWADQTKVMQGYGPSYTEFGPMDNITREQFAQIVYNYAKALGKDMTVDMAAAQAKPDWSSVSGWAQTAVAWAVQNEVIGVNSPINPQGIVTRAEAAAMTTRYQPTRLTTPLVPSYWV